MLDETPLLIRLSDVEAVDPIDHLKEYIAKGELTLDVIRGVVRTYLNKECDMTKTEIALSFGIEQTMPSTIMESFYHVGGRFQNGNGEISEDHIDMLIDQVSG